MFNNNGFMVYKSLENKLTPLLSADDGTEIEFSLVVAHSEPITYTWTLQGSDIDGRLSTAAQFADIKPILLNTEAADTRFLTVRVDVDANSTQLTETAHLELQSKTRVLYFVINLSMFSSSKLPPLPPLPSLGPAAITSAPSDNRDVLTGTAIMFTCEVSGTPTPSITWYHNGLPLASSGGVIVAGSVVTIASALVKHSGMYQCFADNEISNVFMSWTLQVREPGVYVCLHCMCVFAACVCIILYAFLL